MHSTIYVAPFSDNEEMSIESTRFFHVDCSSEEMKSTRSCLDNAYTLQCPCGLEVRLEPGGPAENAIVFTAIDEQPHELQVGAFYSSQAESISVVGNENCPACFSRERDSVTCPARAGAYHFKACWRLTMLDLVAERGEVETFAAEDVFAEARRIAP